MFHRATILHVVERLAFKRVHEPSGRGELHICGMPLRAISFLDFAANAVFTSLEVEFKAQASVLLYGRTLQNEESARYLNRVGLQSCLIRS